jgi:pilus assembly protein TadC
MRTRMYGGVTGKASDGLPMSIQPRVVAALQPWDRKQKNVLTLKGFALRGTLSGFILFFDLISRVVAALQPWAGVSQRLRR